MLVGFLFALILLSGCIEEESMETSLIGFWQDQDTDYNSFEFFEDGTCLINGRIDATYELEEIEFEGTYLVIRTDHGKTFTYNFQMYQMGNKMNLQEINEGNVYTLRKQ